MSACLTCKPVCLVSQTALFCARYLCLFYKMDFFCGGN
jgi:hypothetical protein